MYDVIIIGGGPAGLTAGIYCLRANLKTLILEKESFGGQIASSPLVENYPGFLQISGAELGNKLYEQVENLGADIEVEEALEIIPGKIKKVITDYNTYETKSIIIATGSKYRLLGLDNEEKYLGNGISFCTSCDGAFYKNKITAVIGGGNTAVTNAIYLSDICEKVYLIYRGEKLKCEEKLIEKLKNKNNIELILNSNVIKLNGVDVLEEITIRSGKEEKVIKIDGMFESIGMDPSTEIVKSLLKLNENNYIISSDCKTNEEGIFVAGDCREKNLRQLTTATSDGAIAATNVISYIKLIS